MQKMSSWSSKFENCSLILLWASGIFKNVNGPKGRACGLQPLLGRCLGWNQVVYLGGDTPQGWARFLQKAIYALINVALWCYFSQSHDSQVQRAGGRNGSGTTHCDPNDPLE